MGEVFRARDTRLGRDVAVKIPPPEMAHDPARSQRFEQEARAIAALNHPNIVAIYDVGEGYIVSELIDGDSLGQVKLGLRNTIDAGVRMVRRVGAAAHAAGITHREILKPGNIMLTRDGRVKILDFGRAELAGPQNGGSGGNGNHNVGHGVSDLLRPRTGHAAWNLRCSGTWRRRAACGGKRDVSGSAAGRQPDRSAVQLRIQIAAFSNLAGQRKGTGAPDAGGSANLFTASPRASG